GARLVAAPGRPRWSLAILAAGVLAIALAVVAGTLWPALGARWLGAAHPVTALALAALAAGALGPLTAVASLVGLASLARARYGEIATLGAVVGALLVDLRAGALGPATIGVAAGLSGLAIVRLARMIRIPSGQVVVGVAAGTLVVAPPAWTAIEHPAAEAAHSGQASR